MNQNTIISLFGGLLLFYSQVSAQGPTLEKSFLDQQKVFTSLEEALQNIDSVYILDLHDQELNRLDPRISQLKRLQKLIIYSNQLKSLPPELASLANLEYLDAYSNQLTELPDSFRNMSRLRYLDLGNNRFKEVPGVVFALDSLEHLYLYGNRLKALDARVENLKALKYLRLGGGFKILRGGNRIWKLPDEMGELESLEELYLPDNQLRKLPESMAKLDRLKWLDLTNNRFTRIPQVLQHMSNLQTFSIWDRGFSGKAKQELESKIPDTRLVYDQDYEGNLWGIVAGFQQGKESVVELGISRAYKKDILLIALALSGELNLDGDMSGFKFSVWANGLTLFSFGMHGIYYLEDEQNNFALRPEIGLGLGMWSLNYGYNILFRADSRNINRHMISLRVIVPFRPYFSVFK